MTRPPSLLVLCLAVSAAGASELREVNVDREDGVFVMHSVVWFDADINAVYNVFLDWDLTEQFSSVVVESRNTGSDENGDRGFYVKNRGCLMFFCMSAERVGSVEHKPLEYIKTTVDPEQSDFLIADESWEFEPNANGTLITYHLQMQPKFWVPPLVGSYVIKKKLRDDGLEAMDRIEAIAQKWPDGVTTNGN